MKRYHNEQTGKTYYEGRPMIHRVSETEIWSGVPTAEQLAAWGYTEVEEPVYTPTPYVPTYEELVVQKIRERYTVDDELAILRQRDTKPEEFAQYNTFCEACKTAARTEIAEREEA